MVSLVDKDRQWFKSRVGLGVQETHRDLAMCSHVVYAEGTECMVVSDTWQVIASTPRPPRVNLHVHAADFVSAVATAAGCCMRHAQTVGAGRVG